MKKFITLFILSVAFSNFSKSQTTIEEYNYVTKGYKVQLESGLDMKKGYEIVDLESQATDMRTANLKKLLRVKDSKKTIAAYMLVYQVSGKDKEYICIPSPKSDKEIIDKYWNTLYDGGIDSSYKLQLISYLLSRNLNW